MSLLLLSSASVSPEILALAFRNIRLAIPALVTHNVSFDSSCGFVSRPMRAEDHAIVYQHVEHVTLGHLVVAYRNTITIPLHDLSFCSLSAVPLSLVSVAPKVLNAARRPIRLSNSPVSISHLSHNHHDDV